MNSIEMTDVDGDALTIITRGTSTWITSTRGREEVTVGPFPTQLIRGAMMQGDEVLEQDLRQVSIAAETADIRADQLLTLG